MGTWARWHRVTHTLSPARPSPHPLFLFGSLSDRAASQPNHAPFEELAAIFAWDTGNVWALLVAGSASWWNYRSDG